MGHQRSPKADPGPTNGLRRRTRRLAIGTFDGAAPELRDLLCDEDVAQIVHDLRDPLATLALETHGLEDKLACGDNLELRTTVGRVIRNVELVDRMLQDLIDSCAADEGRFELHRQPAELRALLAQVVDQVVPAGDRGRVTLEAPRPSWLSIDELRIQRVVANLLANALRRTPRPGRIAVRLELEALVARVSVTDGGPGPSPAEAAYVFDKYRRDAAAHALDGCGLGLYASKQIVETHGGRIGVERARDLGSRFYFELPVRPA